ncbi:hypothetical protein HMPREF1143_0094 [Peptoanaerobacter stomatis]|uniref:Uncharacterized protein n=1 Tax=Peptoanaerobacter stomatis TaxID=796937 RepID=J5U7E6_9FIRM|nr:hypothetical protein [Peptoanaerobacter stomatis]EJU20374.1 hypothetical protein HMPREF1143_0094 [Peptoanaerobacter stomatis]
MEFDINVSFSRRDLELIIDAIRDKVKTDEVMNDPNRLCEYMKIYDKASSIVTLLKISECEKAKKISDEDYEDEDYEEEEI